MPSNPAVGREPEESPMQMFIRCTLLGSAAGVVLASLVGGWLDSLFPLPIYGLGWGLVVCLATALLTGRIAVWVQWGALMRRYNLRPSPLGMLFQWTIVGAAVGLFLA